jgi:hypothetical protein
LSVDELAGFQNEVAEIDHHSMASMIVLAARQREMLSQLRLNRLERLVVQPVSLREVRSELQSALNCRGKAPSTSLSKAES